MNYQTLKPVAFIGPQSAEIIHKLYELEQRFLPLEVPATSKLDAVLSGLEPLGYLGAIITGNQQTELAKLVPRKSRASERDGVVDAISVAGGLQGSHTLEDALLNTLERVGFRAFGASALILGGGPTAFAATQLARAGLRTINIAASDRPSAERIAKTLPAGVFSETLAINEPRLRDVLETVDLLVLASQDVRIEPTLLQPYHTILEAAGETNLSVVLERTGGQVISHATVRANHLAAQIEFATGYKFDPGNLV